MTRPRAERVILPSGLASWTVVDGRGLPVEPVEAYLHWLRATGRSSNTVRAYARHLSLLFRWLDAHRVAWERLTFEQVCAFVLDLTRGTPPLVTRGGGPRAGATVSAAMSAVSEFLDYHRLEGRGPTDLRLHREAASSARTRTHFLRHVEERLRPARQRRIRPRIPTARERIEVIGFEDEFARLLDAAGSFRDRLLLSALYDLGLRVGQALGLRHGDLDIPRRRVTVERREDNPNGALSKQRATFAVTAPPRFFELYSRYLLDELLPAGIDVDHLLVNLHREPLGRPMTYGNARDVVARAGRVVGRSELTPHVLRHTHATALARAGWTAAEIAARLGHSSSASCDVYVHLATEDIDRKLAETARHLWPAPAPERV